MKIRIIVYAIVTLIAIILAVSTKSPEESFTTPDQNTNQNTTLISDF